MMTKWIVTSSSLHGKIRLPPSKSHTLRALIFSLMAQGKSTLANYLRSPDTNAMIQAIRLLGAKVDISDNLLTVEGTGGKLKIADDCINCGNSGQVLRFIGALAALSGSYTILTGDASIRHNRPIKPLLDGLEGLGAFAVSSRGDGYAPIIIKGPLSKQKTFLSGEDSQPVSALLIAASFLPHPVEIHVSNPGEKPWINLTLDWLKKFKIPFENHNFELYRLKGNASIPSFNYSVPSDFSSAAFPIAAALLTRSELSLYPIDMDDVQGDKEIIPLLQEMGALFEIDSKNKILNVKKGPPLKGKKIDVNHFIDALPILSVIACFSQGETEIINAAIARKKESDRIHSIALELKKMGADLEERPDGLLIRPSKLQGNFLNAHEDHRIALSLAVAALAAQGESVIDGVETIEKSYPTFFEDFSNIDAKIIQCLQ